MTNDVQAVVRLPSSVVRELDALARKLSKPGMKVTRATAIRMLIMDGLASLLRAQATTRKEPDA